MDFLHALQFSRYATRMLAAHARDGEWLAAAVDAPFDWEQEWMGVRDALARDDAAALSRPAR
jgi:hypothetical protein